MDVCSGLWFPRDKVGWRGRFQDWAFPTPTVADLLGPLHVPGLKMLVLGGEAPTADKIRRWHDKMFLINGYVLAETTIWCNARGRLKGNSDPANFGPPIGARVWVTDAGNRSVLLPVTAVRELPMGEPLVSRGYTDPERPRRLSSARPNGSRRPTQESLPTEVEISLAVALMVPIRLYTDGVIRSRYVVSELSSTRSRCTYHRSNQAFVTPSCSTRRRALIRVILP